jgi:hypothetical protein
MSATIFVRFQIRQIGNQYSVVDSHTGKTWYSGPSLSAARQVQEILSRSER